MMTLLIGFTIFNFLMGIALLVRTTTNAMRVHDVAVDSGVLIHYNTKRIQDLENLEVDGGNAYFRVVRFNQQFDWDKVTRKNLEEPK